MQYLLTVQVTPDAELTNGGLGYIHYVAATDRFIVMAQTRLDAGQEVNLTYGSGTCTGCALAYKEFDTDMQPTGRFGYVSCPLVDVTTRLIGNDLYVAEMAAGPLGPDGQPSWFGWRLERFDVTTWQRLAVREVHLDYPAEQNGGPNISFVNGEVDVASGYKLNGEIVGSHHHRFTRDLTPLGEKILQPPDYPRHMGASMLQPADDILLAAHDQQGLIVLRMDEDWELLEQRHLRQNAIMPTGFVSEGGRFYVGYTDVTGGWSNTGLAVYDSAWNLLDDIALTRYTAADNISATSSWVETHGGHIYASWDTFIESQGGGGATPLQDYVSVFEISTSSTTCSSFTISPTSASPTASAGSRTVTVTGSPSGCTGGSWSASGNGSWLTVSPSSGTGSGSVTVSWEANTDASPRTSTATIAGSSFTVNQAGSGGASGEPRRVRGRLGRSDSLPLRHLTTVRVTPDDTVLAGSFIRLGYVPALDRMVAAFTTAKLVQPEGGCTSVAHVYKVYTTDMQPEGRSVVLNCGFGDSADVFVDNDLYDVTDTPTGWRITRYDAVSWRPLAEIDYVFSDPRMFGGDEMAEMVNGMLDVSGMYGPPGPDLGDTATHHNFFSPDLQFLGERVLSDTRNTNGSSMIFVDDTYDFITGSPGPNVILMRYDTDWNYLGAKVLREHGFWSEGVAFDGQRFYVAYMDTSLVTGPPTPICTNIHLAAFDRNWDFLGELAVTNYIVADDVEAWRPWVAIHGNRMYVSYDVVPHNPVLHTEVPDMAQAYVEVYELPPQ